MAQGPSHRHDNPWHLADRRDEGAMWLAWLVRLRWVAMFGQLVTLSFAAPVLDQPVFVVPAMLLGVGLLGVVNVQARASLKHHEHVAPSTLFGHLLLDILMLTVFLAASGGSSNPFVALYLIHVAMAAVMMPRKDALLLMAVVVAANAVLHRLSLPLHLERHTLPPPVLVAAGQIAAFTVTVLSVGIFTLGTAATLRRQKQRLLEARDRAYATDRLRAVGTLAAGAAHELNTPLSTMDLRLRRIARRHSDEPTLTDLSVVQDQLERCIEVVGQLAVGAGDPSASGFRRAALQELVSEALHLWSKGSPLDVVVRLAEGPIPVELPDIAFTQALTNLLENAREAQAEVGSSAPLEVEVVRDGTWGVVRVVDHGRGLPSDADRVGEPFFTTKPHGTGLGVFVARALADGAGGSLTYHRERGRTVAAWRFPQTARTA